MNLRIIGNFIGHILRIEGLFMFPALFISLYKNEHNCAIAFGITIAVTMVLGHVLLFIKPKRKEFFAREGFAIVSLSWLIMSLFGALPFYISGEIPSLIDCFFETISGFTTTGASVLTEVESMSASLLYWRSFTHWLGGMGILVFVLAIIPQGQNNRGDALHILRAESPGPSVGKLTSKMRQTARILYAIYIALTVFEMLMLFAGGMPLFDSVVNSFATAGTGGFAIKNASIGSYDSYYLQAVIGVFMLLFGINFNIFHLLLLREYSKALHNEELKLYLGIVGASIVIITINTHSMFSSWFEALHHSFFQVSSIVTTTGFATVDFNLWPELSKIILVILMIVGACAGSTGGGFKVARVLILIKGLRNELQKMVHPRSVKVMKIDGKAQSDKVIHSVTMYSVAYVLIMIASILIVSANNFSFETTTTAVISCLNNIGPGFDMVGPMGNFSEFSILSKLVLSADMIIGRLEIFPVIILFSPALWKRCN